MIIKYVNSAGEFIDLNTPSLRLKDTNFHTYEWKYNSRAQTLGIDVDGFWKSEAIFPATICAFGSIAARKTSFNEFFEIVEYDVVHKTPGKLYYDEYYIDCFILSGTTVPGEYYTQRTISIMAPKNTWKKIKRREFYVGTNESSASGLDYPYDYPYDYSSTRSGNAFWEIDNVSDSDFEMTIYGPCSDPVVYINGWPYQIFTELNVNEHIIVDSAKHSVVKYLSNGISEDIFDLRGKTYSIFQKIPPGKLSIVWSGSFGFDITLFLERSEPKWKLS